MEDTHVCYKAESVIKNCYATASIVGEIVEQSPIYVVPQRYEREYFGYDFFRVKVKRSSGTPDYITCAACDGAFLSSMKLGNTVKVVGRIERLELLQNGEPKYIMVVFADRKAEILEASKEDININRICVEGYLTKPIRPRSTLTEKRISDMFMSLQKEERQNGYVPVTVLPCIVWDRVMDDIKNNYEVGDKIEVIGRLQSRAYQKNEKDYEVTEISIARVSKVLPLKSEDKKIDIDISDEFSEEE